MYVTKICMYIYVVNSNLKFNSKIAKHAFSAMHTYAHVGLRIKGFSWQLL